MKLTNSKENKSLKLQKILKEVKGVPEKSTVDIILVLIYKISYIINQ